VLRALCAVLFLLAAVGLATGHTVLSWLPTHPRHLPFVERSAPQSVSLELLPQPSDKWRAGSQVRSGVDVQSHRGKSEIVEVTAYCFRAGIGIQTADGDSVHLGSAAAGSDVPFGTRFNVPDLWTVTVDDRGSAVEAGHLDVWMPSCLQADKWGVRYVRVQRLGK
jgi:3D (Asp-Asp-Asp) domain-containing protein